MSKPWEPIYQWRCRLCFDNGAMFAVKKESPGDCYVFKCSCPMGTRDRRNFQTWSNADKSIFEQQSSVG